MKCCMCGCHSEPSHVYCIAPEVDSNQLRLVCEAHMIKDSCLELNIPMIEKSTNEMYDFVNYFTAKAYETISLFQSELLESCFMYK